MRQAATTPLPRSFHKNEPGLLTVKEYLEALNPEGKYHSEDSFQFTKLSLNTDYSIRHVGRNPGTDFSVFEGTGGHIFKDDGSVVGVLYQKTLYHDKWKGRKIESGYYANNSRGEWVALDIKKRKTVKYPEDYIALFSDVAKRNRTKYSQLIQTFEVGERLQLRAATDGSLAVINSSGERVAIAQDEWGATLIAVAPEYQRLGLASRLGTLWYKRNPEYRSGGFTPAGERMAMRRWQARVQEFLSYGWYSELVRLKRLTPARVKEITKDLTKKPTARPKPIRPKPKKKSIAIYANDAAFIVYDPQFLQEPDENHIYAYGLFESSPHVGLYLYQIDYERSHAKIATAVALQMSKDKGESIYIGEGYGDTIEYHLIKEVEVEGDHIRLKRDILNVRMLSMAEKTVRRKLDPYGELESTLIETAEGKWR